MIEPIRLTSAPVGMRVLDPDHQLGDLPWRLLGAHSSRLDVGIRDLILDAALGRNCVWYADILLTLAQTSR